MHVEIMPEHLATIDACHYTETYRGVSQAGKIIRLKQPPNSIPNSWKMVVLNITHTCCLKA